jgi:hypothetical protein
VSTETVTAPSPHSCWDGSKCDACDRAALRHMDAETASKIAWLFRDMAWTKSHPWDNATDEFARTMADNWRERAMEILRKLDLRYHDSNGPC